MSTLYRFILLFGVLFLLNPVAAKAQQSAKGVQRAYNESLQNWEKFKDQGINSYDYVLVYEGVMSGIQTTHDIKVRNHQVTEVLVRTRDRSGKITNKRRYKQGELGEVGVPVPTLDEIYDFAKAQVIYRDTEAYHLTFEATKLGLIKRVGYTPIGCVDDCFQGYVIQGDIRWVQK
ncbi:hypothetical protein [Eisenibacter elegans]|jgi:hypothetical protein|uniref:hypothetical protein n=1 Tax=Eisenibacter elegans TaxID=997 RepID=UPI000407B1B5|nr:hypothetical protein [Eisenibacter elegans]